MSIVECRVAARTKALLARTLQPVASAGGLQDGLRPGFHRWSGSDPAGERDGASLLGLVILVGRLVLGRR